MWLLWLNFPHMYFVYGLCMQNMPEKKKKLSGELGICPACGKSSVWPSPLHLSCCHARRLSPQAISAAGVNWGKKRYLGIISSHKQRLKSILKQPMGVESQSGAQGEGEGHLEPHRLSDFVACCASLELVAGLFFFFFCLNLTVLHVTMESSPLSQGDVTVNTHFNTPSAHLAAPITTAQYFKLLLQVSFLQGSWKDIKAF